MYNLARLASKVHTLAQAADPYPASDAMDRLEEVYREVRSLRKLDGKLTGREYDELAGVPVGPMGMRIDHLRKRVTNGLQALRNLTTTLSRWPAARRRLLSYRAVVDALEYLYYNWGGMWVTTAGTVVARTQPIVLEYPKELEKKYGPDLPKVELGRLQMAIPPQAWLGGYLLLEWRTEQATIKKFSSAEYTHPHISSNGFCLGGEKAGYAKLWTKQEFADVFYQLEFALQSYMQHAAYRHLIEWELKCSNCNTPDWYNARKGNQCAHCLLLTCGCRGKIGTCKYCSRPQCHHCSLRCISCGVYVHKECEPNTCGREGCIGNGVYCNTCWLIAGRAKMAACQWCGLDLQHVEKTNESKEQVEVGASTGAKPKRKRRYHTASSA